MTDSSPELPTPGKSRSMETILILLGILGAWLLVTKVVLPRFGAG
ncbi:MAG: hypothetical protein ACKVX7_15955 [Planctomycetota bacterium]